VRALAAACLVAVAAIGCGGSSQAGFHVDFGDETWSGAFWEVRALCPGGRLTVEFEPGARIAVLGSSETVATADLSGLGVSCAEPERRTIDLDVRSAYDDRDLRGPLTNATTLVCSLVGEIEVSAHPIWYQTSYITGSGISLATAERKIALSASMKRSSGKTYSELFYSPALCAAR
jgi:hypothetical protein